MFLRFNCVLLTVMIFAARISPLLLHGNAWGGLSLGVCDMHNYDILSAGMLWKPKEARILKNFIDQPVNIR
jgi:hypothetical protein